MITAQSLTERFKKQIEAISQPDLENTGDFIRLTCNWDMTGDIVPWLLAHQIPERFYFRDKEGDFELAGLGSGYVIKEKSQDSVSSQLEKLWNTDPETRVFGGMCFDPSRDPDKEWQAFNAYRFTIPLVEICRENNTTKISLNYFLEGRPDRDSIVRQLEEKLRILDHSFDSAEPVPQPGKLKEIHIPEKHQWLKIIKRALAAIHGGDISKIVLARKKILTSATPWSVKWIMEQLDMTREKAFLFLYQPDRDVTFLGRTPERLFHLDKKQLIVDAIAGTEPRGATETEDQRFAEALTDSPKEHEEHQIVARYVKRRMKHLCSKSETGAEAQVLKLNKVQHLVTRFFGTPRNGLTAFDTLLSLHPTPAVGVEPPESRNMITELEPFKRGWYAGPIGWMNRHTADFAVAIRSALVYGKELHIFAGAGIVEESDPEMEWQEIRDKMSNFSFIPGAV